MEGGEGGDPPQAPISYLVTYELFETLMYSTVTPPQARNPMDMYGLNRLNLRLYHTPHPEGQSPSPPLCRALM